MRAGRLRHRLRLQQSTRTRSATGAFTNNWATTATVWGAIEGLSSREFHQAGQAQTETSLRAVIRHAATWAAIDNTWRIQEANSGKKYNIVSVIEPEERTRPGTMIEMMVEESKADDE